MSAMNTLNIGMEGLCIVICGLLIVQICIIHTKRDTDKWFLFALISNITMMAGDMANWIWSGQPGKTVRVLLFTGSTLYFASSGVLMYSFFSYIYRYVNVKKPLPKPPMAINTVLMFVQIALAVSSPFFGTIFTYDIKNTYTRGFLFLASQATAAAAYLTVIWILLYSRKSMNRKERVYFGIYVTLLAVSELIQVLNYGMPLLNIAFTMSFLLISLFINSEMDEMIKTAEKEHEEERIALMEHFNTTMYDLSKQTIHALSSAVEAKDRYTNGHSLRVAEYSTAIVKRMGWNEEQQRSVYFAGLLHDVGKIRISDAIINKKGRLDDSEYEEIKLHTLTGYYILKEISAVSDFAAGARWHHERYDGRGYPNGLAGEDIPVIARIIGVADAYDAMTSNRSYRKLMPQSKVREEIEKGAGSQFDPDIAKIMLDMIDDDKEYRMRQPDSLLEKNILIIDTDKETLDMLESLKEELTCNFVTIPSPAESAHMLEEVPVSLIIFSADELDDNGADFISWIKENHGDIPAVALTRDKSLLHMAADLGIEDCMTKPLKLRMLSESIQNILLNSKDMVLY